MCNEYEHDIFFPSSPFERQIQIEDRQPGNDGWLDLSTIICRAGPRHCEQCSKALVIDGILMVDGYVYVYIIYIYIFIQLQSITSNLSFPSAVPVRQEPAWAVALAAALRPVAVWGSPSESSSERNRS